MSRPARKRRVLVAPDKFRGTATAPQAAGWLSEGLRRHLPAGLVAVMPIADGGEGTLDCFVAAGFGARPVIVSGPLGEPARPGSLPGAKPPSSRPRKPAGSA